MRLASTTVLLSLAVVLSVSACHDDQKKAVPTDEAADLLINRSWIDHMPESTSERLHVYRFTPAMGGGIYQDRTMFAGKFELFMFEVEGDTLRIKWPHRDLAEKVHFRIERIDGPKPFDLRLELRGNSTGPSVYYGMSGDGRNATDPLRLRLQ